MYHYIFFYLLFRLLLSLQPRLINGAFISEKIMKKKMPHVVQIVHVSTAYRIHKGKVKDYMLEHWYDGHIRVCEEYWLYTTDDGNVHKRYVYGDPSYCDKLDLYTIKEHYAWCCLYNGNGRLERNYEIDKDFVCCEKVTRHISEEEENKLLSKIFIQEKLL